MQNVELKARYPDLEAGRRIAGRLGADHVGRERQIDTYFTCPSGRLKLRESSRTGATLVWYARPDRPHAKVSHYLLADTADGPAMVTLLREAFGQGVVVDKQRDLYLWQNVRIHLDEVSGLGRFLEFEAVVGPDDPPDQSRRKVDHLTGVFGIKPGDLLPGSYADMLTQQTR